MFIVPWMPLRVMALELHSILTLPLSLQALLPAFLSRSLLIRLRTHQYSNHRTLRRILQQIPLATLLLALLHSKLNPINLRDILRALRPALPPKATPTRLSGLSPPTPRAHPLPIRSPSPTARARSRLRRQSRRLSQAAARRQCRLCRLPFLPPPCQHIRLAPFSQGPVASCPPFSPGCFMLLPRRY